MQDNDITSNKKDEIKKEIEIRKQIEGYEDTEGLSTKKLNFGLWYVGHKRDFRKIFIGLLIAFSAITWAYSIYGFAYYIARGMEEDEILVKTLAQNNAIDHNYIKQISAQDLRYYQVNIFNSSQGQYDLAARVDNPNKEWWAEIDYYFSEGSSQIGGGKTFIFPNESKYLIALAQDFKARPVNVQLVVKKISWHRINRHEIADWQDYKDNHLNIIVENIKFTPADKSNFSEKINLNQVDFDVINKTAYNYWQVDFPILLYSGDNLIGVNRYTLSELMSGENRRVEVRWSGNLGRINKVDIAPELNILKEDIYIKFEGGIGEEK